MKQEYAYLKWYMPKNQKVLLTLVVFGAAINAVTMGYDTMMMSSLIAVGQFTNYFDLTPTANGFMNASMWIGNILSCLLMTFCADRLGRKNTIIIASLLSFIGIILQTASQNMAMFIVSRIILGFCIEITGAASPLLIAEMAPKNIRGFLVGMYFTCFNAGGIIASGVTYGTAFIDGTWAWRLPSLLQGLPSLVSIVSIMFVPESPRWLIAQEKPEYAQEVFQVVLNVTPKEAENVVENVRCNIEHEKHETSGAWTALFTLTPANKRRLLSVFILALVAELGGSSVGSYYFTVILEQAGIQGTAKLLQINIISSCWNFVCAVAGSCLFDYFGRKMVAFVTVCGMIVSFFLLGGFIKLYGDSNNPSGQYAAIFFMFLFNGFYNFSITPLNCLYPSELFPMRTRAAGTTFFKFWNCGFGLFATFILPIAMANVSWKFYMVNGGYDIIFAVLIWFVWVETKGLTLEEVSELLGEEVTHVEFVSEEVSLKK